MLTNVCAALLFLAANHPAPEPAISVPRGTAVMIDGKISPGEWNDAKSIALGEARVWVKHAADFVWIAVEFPPETHGFTDLLISPVPAQVVDLHASAKLGERTMNNAGWTEWKWWNNDRWVANVSRVESFDKKAFLPENVREYQIARSRFPAKTWKVMLQLSTEGQDGAYHQTALPENAKENDPSSWLQFTFLP